MVAWYGGASRDSEVVMGTRHWYRSGEDLVEVRWVSIQDGTRTHRDGYALTTDLTMRPPQMGEYDTQRWSIDTTCQESREDLMLESIKGDGQHTVLRECGVVLHTRSVVCPNRATGVHSNR